MGIVILSDIESLSEVLLELRLGLRVVDREVVVLLSELLVARCHPTRCLMRREDSVNLARDAEAGLLSFLLKGFSLVRIHRREHLNSDWTPVNTSRAVSLELDTSLDVPLDLLRVPDIQDLVTHLEGDDIMGELVEVVVHCHILMLKLIVEDIALDGMICREDLVGH